MSVPAALVCVLLGAESKRSGAIPGLSRSARYLFVAPPQAARDFFCPPRTQLGERRRRRRAIFFFSVETP